MVSSKHESWLFVGMNLELEKEKSNFNWFHFQVYLFESPIHVLFVWAAHFIVFQTWFFIQALIQKHLSLLLFIIIWTLSLNLKAMCLCLSAYFLFGINLESFMIIRIFLVQSLWSYPRVSTLLKLLLINPAFFGWVSLVLSPWVLC